MKRLVMDLDDTISFTIAGNYSEASPNLPVIEKLRQYQDAGFEIVIHSSRNVRTYEGSVGKITAFTVPIMIEWLNKHDVPYDEIVVGKPWCGYDGFYVDDKAVRPDEFASKSYEEVMELIGRK